VAPADLWTPGLLLAAFAGGALGASIGALNSFALAGAAVVSGETYAALLRALGTAPATVPLTDQVAFGVVLGPHVAFGGGAAAVAYAAREGYVEADGPLHPGKRVTTGLGSRPDVLAVGGAFGVAGHWLTTLSGSLALPWDPVAFGVVASALLHRAVLGYSVLGVATGGRFDMSGYDDGRGTATTDGGRPTAGAPVPWLPYQYRWPDVALLGVAGGVAGAYVAYVTGSPFLAFGASAASLALLCAGVQRVPITHHMTLPASTVVVMLVPGAAVRPSPAAIAAAVPLEVALLAGAVVGLAGALAGELSQRALWAHAETHLDPPAAGIVVATALLAAAAALGVLPSAAWIPLP